MDIIVEITEKFTLHKCGVFWEPPSEGFGVLTKNFQNCAFLIEMFGLHVCEGHWYLKWLNKMNKLQVALDRHKLHRVEEQLQETQKLKSKVRTEFKVFCIAITCSLHWEVKWRCNHNYCIETGMSPPLSPPSHQTKVRGLQYFQALL